jgi:lysophospholipase
MLAPFALLGHSMGGHIGLRFLHDHPHKIARAVVTSPMTAIKTGPVPMKISSLGVKMAAWVLGPETGLAGGARSDPINAPYAQNVLCRSEPRYRRLIELLRAEPNLVCGAPTLGWADAAGASMAMLAEASYLNYIDLPTLAAIAGDDQLIEPDSQRRMASFMPGAEILEIPGAQHEILMEADDIRRIFWEAFDRCMVSE